jgi:hypothetical protein
MATFVLAEDDDWELVHAHQDVRGWPVEDEAERRLGTVDRLVASTDTERVETLVLNSGEKVDADAAELRDGVVRVHTGGAPGADVVAETYATTSGVRRRLDGFDALDDAFRAHHEATYASLADPGEPYRFYEPAYRLGYRYGVAEEHRAHDYATLKPQMRRDYETRHGEGTFEAVEDAVRHAFRRARSS